jgi:hypothetical protein
MPMNSRSYYGTGGARSRSLAGRLFPVVATTTALILLVGLAPAGASPSARACAGSCGGQDHGSPEYAATYSGNLTYTLSGSVPNDSITLKRTATLKWSESYSGNQDKGAWTLSSLSGSMTETGTSSGQPIQCDMSFSVGSSDVGGLSVYPSGPGQVAVSTFGWPVANIAVAITSNNNLALDCTSGSWSGGSGTEWIRNTEGIGSPARDALDPQPVFPAGKSATQPFNLNYTCKTADGCPVVYGPLDFDGTAAYKLTSSVSFSPIPPKQKLEILATIAGKQSAAQDKTTKLAIGQHVTLEARFADGAPLGSPDWKGLDPADLIESRTWLPHRGEVTAFDTAHLKDKDLSFYWITGSTPAVSVSAVDTRTGVSYQATAHFEVQAPEMTEFAARTCRADLTASRTAISFGYNRQCSDEPGIQWWFDVQAPPDTAGRVGVTQLINQRLTHNGNACLYRKYGNAYLANGEFTALDNSFWTGNHFVDLGPGQASERQEDRDSPDNSIVDKGTWQDRFNASDWLMFLPSETGSIPVAIGTFDWNFDAVARWALDPQTGKHHFRLVHAGGTQDKDLTYTAPADQPTWDRLFENGPFSC